MEYQIYQIDNDCLREYGFRRFDDMIKNYGMIPKTVYNKMYESKIDYEGEPLEVVCENIFHIFNMSRPTDFTGHSLSMGDVVVVNHIPFYCDYAGFKKISQWY